MAVWLKFKSLCVELGPSNALLYGMHLLFSRVGGGIRIVRYYFFAQPVGDNPILSGRRGKSIEIRIFSKIDPALNNLPLDDTVIQYRFEQNALCFGAFKENLVIGCLWLCFDGYHEDEIRCSYAPKPENATAWDFDVYVHHEFRTGFVFAKLWDEANAFMRARGIRWSVSRISAFNPVSLTSHRSLGARRCGSLIAFCIGPCELKLASTKPHFHLSFGSGPIPKYGFSTPKEEMQCNRT